MNGRIYDPLLGRFLSADLIVQSPASLQSYNRYSYVLNNPLTSIDENGFQAVPPNCAPLAGMCGPGGGVVLNAQLGEAMSAAQQAGMNPQKVVTAAMDEDFRRNTNEQAKEVITAYSILGSFAGASALSVPARGLMGVLLNAGVDAGVFGGTGYVRTVGHNAIDGKPLTQGAAETAVKEGAWAALGGALARGVAKFFGRIEGTAPKPGAPSARRPTAAPPNEIGALRGPARSVGPGEGILIGPSQGLQSRQAGLFENVKMGEHGDKATKYLWTVDNRGVNIALEQTPMATSRGTIVHTNISSEASIGGEAWFGPNNTVTINAGSGRFGDGAGVAASQWEATRKYWESLGYNVNAIPLGQR